MKPASSISHAEMRCAKKPRLGVRPRGQVITVKEQLFGISAFYEDRPMSYLPAFSPDSRVNTLVVLGQYIFNNIRCAAFNSYIPHRSHESAFIVGAYSSYEDDSFMLIAVNVFALDLFPDDKVGVIAYKGKASLPQSRPDTLVGP